MSTSPDLGSFFFLSLWFNFMWETETVQDFRSGSGACLSNKSWIYLASVIYRDTGDGIRKRWSPWVIWTILLHNTTVLCLVAMKVHHVNFHPHFPPDGLLHDCSFFSFQRFWRNAHKKVHHKKTLTKRKHGNRQKICLDAKQSSFVRFILHDSGIKNAWLFGGNAWPAKWNPTNFALCRHSGLVWHFQSGFAKWHHFNGDKFWARRRIRPE